MTLFGVLSRCMFSELSHVKPNAYTVDVAPVLPSIHISSDLPKSPYMVTGGDNMIVTSAILQIYVGEQLVQLNNMQVHLAGRGTGIGGYKIIR